MGRKGLGLSKVNGHGLPMVCVSALINEFARPSKAQSVLVFVQLHKQESARSIKSELRVVVFT